LTPQRRVLRSWWFLAGVGVALLLFLPNLLWLIHNGFPFLEFERHSRMTGSRIIRSPLAFVADQALIMNPLLAPLWIAGLIWLLRSKAANSFRFLGWTALLLSLLMIVLQAKNYYLTPIYPVLFAAGAIAFERWTAGRRAWLRPASIGAVALSFVVLAPLVMPILPVHSFLAYQQEMHGFTPVRFEALPDDPLPQYFADEFGWEEMTRRTASVYNSLPEPERRTTAIFANNYGEAAAIDFFGPRYGLPPAVSGNESFWFWGTHGYTGSTVLVLGSDGTGDREHFRTVEPVQEINDPLSRYEERYSLFLCRGLNTNLQTLWPKLKKW
jgi:hypothetical protein